MGLYRAKKARKMDEGKIISLRMGTDELQELDAYLERHPEAGGRSLFIRTAIRQGIARDADAPKTEVSNRDGETVVHLSPADKETLVTLVDRGIYNDIDQAVWFLVHKEIMRMIKNDDTVRSVYEVASSPLEQ